MIKRRGKAVWGSNNGVCKGPEVEERRIKQTDKGWSRVGEIRWCPGDQGHSGTGAGAGRPHR